MTRWIVTVLLLLALLVSGAYFFSPQILTWAAAGFANQYGIQLRGLDVQRPGLSLLRINRLSVAVENYSIDATGIDLNYDLHNLLSQPITSVVLDQLKVLVESTTQESASPSSATALSDSNDIHPEYLFGLMPKISVRELTLQTVEPTFTGEGSFSFDGEQASFQLVGLQPEFAQNIRANALVLRSGQIEVSLFDINRSDQPFLRLSTAQENQQFTAQGQFDLSGYPLALVSRLLDLPAGSGRLQGELSTKFDDVDALSAYADLQADGKFLIDWNNADIQLAGIAGSFTGTMTDMVATFAGGTIDSLPAKMSFMLHSGARAQYTPQKVIMGSGVSVRLQDLDDLQLQARVMNAEIDWSNNAVSLKAAADVDVSAFELSTRGRIDAAVSLLDDKVQAELVLAVAGAKLPVQVVYSIEQSQGSFSAVGQVAAKDLFKSVFTPWPYPFEVKSGKVGFNLLGQLESEVKGTLDVQLDGAVLQVDEYQLMNTAGQLSFVFDDAGARLSPSPVRVAEIDVGLPVQNLMLNLAWRDNVVDITDGQFKLLGGRVFAAPFTYDLDASAAKIDLRVEDIDLALVLALEGDDIKGTGRIFGTLPLRIDEGAVSMSNGQLRASEAGGNIELSPSFSVETGQPGIDFALTALNNFSYTSLSAIADFAPEGDLVLAVSLQGRNPAVEKGRPIHYNLTITENIYALMEALDAQSGITGDIERRVLNKQQR